MNLTISMKINLTAFSVFSISRHCIRKTLSHECYCTLLNNVACKSALRQQTHDALTANYLGRTYCLIFAYKIGDIATKNKLKSKQREKTEKSLINGVENMGLHDCYKSADTDRVWPPVELVASSGFTFTTVEVTFIFPLIRRSAIFIKSKMNSRSSNIVRTDTPIHSPN